MPNYCQSIGCEGSNNIQTVSEIENKLDSKE